MVDKTPCVKHDEWLQQCDYCRGHSFGGWKAKAERAEQKAEEIGVENDRLSQRVTELGLRHARLMGRLYEMEHLLEADRLLNEYAENETAAYVLAEVKEDLKRLRETHIEEDIPQSVEVAKKSHDK